MSLLDQNRHDFGQNGWVARSDTGQACVLVFPARACPYGWGLSPCVARRCERREERRMRRNAWGRAVREVDLTLATQDLITVFGLRSEGRAQRGG